MNSYSWQELTLGKLLALKHALEFRIEGNRTILEQELFEFLDKETKHIEKERS
jgi:hypothetical protein